MAGAGKVTGHVLAGRYRLLRQLGAGGMGRVWLAYDQELACEVALKEIALPPNLPESEMSARIARARREARHAARLRNHPHVATVHDILEEEGLPWIVMEFVPGATDLGAVVHAREPLPPAEVARIGLAVLDALTEGHRIGLLHRDVKPANILLTGPVRDPRPGNRAEGGRVLLTDYGIALQQDSGDTRLTETDMVPGTVSYLAPERLRGQEPTPASDLFSLGATLFFALEGTGPFDRNSKYAIQVALLFEDPPPPLRAGRLTPVVLGLLAKDPARRMDGDEAADRLAPIAAPPPSRPPPPPPTPPAGRPPPEPPPPTPKPTRTPKPATPTEPDEPTGPPPPAPPRTDDATRPRPGPSPRRRRAWLIAAVVLAVLAAGGLGIYLTAPDRSPTPDPTALPTAPTSVSSIRVGDGPVGVAVSPDGRRAYVTNNGPGPGLGPGSVSVIDTTTNHTLGNPIPVGDGPHGVAVSPDGRRVYVANHGWGSPGSVSVITF
ncbi:serine/threonine-protein kinase [Streptomyces flaveus]|uniref:serine/threonine-protein kinase n=1 Tax=Streptomyces flaveus TaxID=66370 RepID=UPI00331BBB65